MWPILRSDKGDQFSWPPHIAAAFALELLIPGGDDEKYRVDSVNNESAWLGALPDQTPVKKGRPGPGSEFGRPA